MKPLRKPLAAALILVGGAAMSTLAQAREYPIGGPVQANDMEIASSYLVGIEMAPMPPGMVMSKDSVHLETDVHATVPEAHG